MRYFLGLGSNLGDRELNLTLARTFLEKKDVKILECSSIYETEPVDFLSQPWFLNQVIEVETEVPPDRLLGFIKDIEDKMGRKRSSSKGPRLIDIDILLAGETVHRSPDLKIPHPRLHERKFVLMPLKEIAPEWVHPVCQKTIQVLAETNRDSSVVRMFRHKQMKGRKVFSDTSE